MTTFVRNTTLSRSRRYKYEALGVPNSGRDSILKSISYRRRRAKQRKIFLTTYKLDSFAEPKSPKLNKVARSLKKFVASVLKLMHYGPKTYASLESQGYAAGYPPRDHKKKRRHHLDGPSGCGCLSFCCCCFFSYCRCCICIILIIIILFVAIALSLYYLFKPYVPSYDFQNIDVKSFDIGKEDKVRSDIVLVVNAHNPNEHIGLDYLENEVGIMYSGSQICSGQIPPFLQPGKNTTSIDVELKGEIELGPEIQNNFMEDQKEQKIPLLVIVRLPIRLVINDFIHLRKFVVSVNCSLVIDKVQPNKRSNILDKDFTYGVEF
ncbi:NDR1/HIN1-like protein 6, partial [Mucuna pruriens]